MNNLYIVHKYVVAPSSSRITIGICGQMVKGFFICACSYRDGTPISQSNGFSYVNIVNKM